MINLFNLFPDHDKNSHGVPGLYFKYDVAALKVIVRQDRDNMVKFLVRLCSIIAGIIVISGNLILFILYITETNVKTTCFFFRNH